MAFSMAAFLAGCSLFSDLGGFSENPAPASQDEGGIDSGGGSSGGNDATTDGTRPPIDAGPDASKYMLEVLADKPMAYWPMDDAPGSALVREIVGGKNAEFAGTLTLGVPGVSGTAMDKSDPSQILEVGDHFDLVDFAPYSIEAWATPKFDTQYLMMIAKQRPNEPYGWSFYFQQQDALDPPGFQLRQVSPNDGQRTVFVQTPTVTIGWHHIVVTYDPNVASGAHMRMYFDGVRTDGYDDDKPAADTMEPVEIARGYTGLLDEIALYDHALTVERVSAHYQAGKK